MTARALLILVACTIPAIAQHDHEAAPTPPARFNRPMQLFPKALGTFHRPISSTNREAHASAVERAIIRATTVRYVTTWEPAKRREYDAAYADAARKHYEQYPRDADAGTLYGEALFVMEPRRGWRDIQAPNVRRIVGVFE